MLSVPSDPLRSSMRLCIMTIQKKWLEKTNNERGVNFEQNKKVGVLKNIDMCLGLQEALSAPAVRLLIPRSQSHCTGMAGMVSMVSAGQDWLQQ